MSLPATDNFDRTDANPIGGNWTTITGYGDGQIVSNVLRGAGTGANGSYWNADSFNDDQYCQFKQASASYQNSHGPSVRVSSSAATFYIFRQESSSVIKLLRFISGSSTQIGSDYSHTYAQGDTLKLSVVGDDSSAVLTPYINDVAQTTQSGYTGINSGSAGYRVYGNVQAMDNFNAGNETTTTVVPTDNYFRRQRAS